MTNRSPRLTRRRFLGGLATVGSASAAAGAGTMAYFSNSETSSDNTIQAGTLNLTLDGGDSAVEFLTDGGIAPGDERAEPATIQLQNTGSLPGDVVVEVASLTSYENGQPGNEANVDSSGGDPGPGNGELQNYLEVSAGFQDGTSLWTGFQTAAKVLDPGEVHTPQYTLSPNQAGTFEFDWQLPDVNAAEAQSDGLQFALAFRLEQKTASGP